MGISVWKIVPWICKKLAVVWAVGALVGRGVWSFIIQRKEKGRLLILRLGIDWNSSNKFAARPNQKLLPQGQNNPLYLLARKIVNQGSAQDIYKKEN